LFVFLSSLSLFSTSLHSSTTPNVWDVLRSQFTLNHDINQPEVQAQLQWFLAHRGYLQQLARSEPYIYHIVTAIKSRRLPGELALLPMIESAYDPFAYSAVGAAGLWQLMPATGTYWGLKQDWWFDARRAIPSSTNAALNYLSYLNRYFNGNWILAIASYDAGEGAVSRAVKSSKNTVFWALPLPTETKIYVPRLLALAEIIQYPERYRITLPDIPHEPYFEEVNIGSQIDLNQAAKLAGISYKDLIKLNPGYNRWATAPYKPFKLLIPRAKVADFSRNLAGVPTEKRVSWTRHQVQNGDALESIAQRYFTTAKLIRELNQLKTDKLIIGQYVLIPSSKNTTVSAQKPTTPIVEADKPISSQIYKVVHIVQPGDSYLTLENKYKVSTSSIQNWNNISNNSPLQTGDQLIIWKQVVQYGAYTVKTGDSLSTIAKRNNTDVKTLTQLNPSISKGQLQPGQQLVIG
jgi:membrane-bound lytic murein transglycosylase D